LHKLLSKIIDSQLVDMQVVGLAGMQVLGLACMPELGPAYM
jgi:hypothetical protein